jgi:hypothetical protein
MRKLSLIKKISKSAVFLLISIIIAFGTVENNFVSFADSSYTEGYFNGYVNTGFINKVNNPKYNSFSGTQEQIDPLTGALVMRQSDITFSGRDGLDLEIARKYNSSKGDILKNKAIYSATPYYSIREEVKQFLPEINNYIDIRNKEWNR